MHPSHLDSPAFTGRRRVLSAAIAGLAAVVAPGMQAMAQSGPITIVVATTAGTGVDVTGRVLGQQLATQLGVPVVVENRAGASGNIGAEHVARSAPDGRTLFVAATTFGTNPSINHKLPFDPIKDFTPIVLLGTGTLCLAVPPSLPVNSVREFVALAKSQPGKVNYASPGSGTPQHMAMELFKLKANIDLFHVPYKGTGGALTDLAGGHVSAMIAPVDSIMPLAAAGKLKILGVMSRERYKELPQIPTFGEEGYPNLEVNVWYGLFAPGGTSKADVTKFNTALNVALKRPDVIESLTKQGIDPAGGTPQQLAELLKSELARWPAVVKAANIQAD